MGARRGRRHRHGDTDRCPAVGWKRQQSTRCSFFQVSVVVGDFELGDAGVCASLLL